MARPIPILEAMGSTLAKRKRVWMVAFDQVEAVFLLQACACYFAAEIS
jgi:hypothetical protein